MSGQHTPGEWFVIASSPHRVSTSDGWISINWGSNIDKGLEVRVEANARLIAAAPELLAALDEVVEAFDMNVVDGATVNMARAAIAKARGA